MKTLKVVKNFALLAGISSMLLGTSALAKGEKYTLESNKVPNVISLDANNPIWNETKAIKFNLAEQPYESEKYKGAKNTDISIKSLYDSNNVYFKVQYDDPTKSVERYPWVKQADGSWKIIKNKDRFRQENTNYEDKFAFFWDINTRGFAKKGCAIACHMLKKGKVAGLSDWSAGRKYTRKDGQTIDMWHAKIVRMSLSYQVAHDQYVDSTKDPKKSTNWGRKGDEKTGGGYPWNKTKDGKTPKYMNPDKSFANGSIKDADKVPFVDTFKVGDMVPSIIVKPFTGSAGDVKNTATYEDGKWTLIFKRALVTNHPKSKIQDVQFSDLSKPYYFGVAAFDNTQINHLYHEGSIKLLFK